jgi:hypothetical protein
VAAPLLHGHEFLGDGGPSCDGTGGEGNLGSGAQGGSTPDCSGFAALVGLGDVRSAAGLTRGALGGVGAR